MNDIQLKGVIDNVVKNLIKLIDFNRMAKAVENSISKDYIRGLEEAGKQVNMNFGGNAMNLDNLQTYSFELVKDINDDLEKKLRKIIQRGLLNDESIQTIQEKIQSAMDVSKGRAKTIARTETSRAQNRGKLDGMKESGLKPKKWLLITYDDRTTQISKAMGAKYGTPEKAIPMDEKFSVTVGGKVYEGQAPPFFFNDRDVLMFAFD